MFTLSDPEVTTSASPYRSTLDAARADLGVALDHEAATLARVLPLTAMAARRTGRVVFGGTLLAAAAAIALAAALGARRTDGGPTVVLAVAFPLASFFSLVSWEWAHRRWRRLWQRAEQQIANERRDQSLDPFHCLEARLTRPSLAESLLAQLDRNETRGPRLVLLGMCLLGPLTSHLWFYLLERAAFEPSMRLGDFDLWIFMSALFVGVAHLALLVYAWWFTNRLAACPPDQAPSAFRPVLVATIGALLPGAPFVLPVFIVFITGIALLPWLFGRVTRTFQDERAELAAIRRTLPARSPRLQSLAARFARDSGL